MQKNKVFSNRFLIISAAAMLLNLIFGGCYSIREVSLESGRTEKIYKIETTDDKIIDFRKTDLGYAFISGDNVVSINEKGEEKFYPIAEIKKYYTEKFDVGYTIFFGIGAAALLIAILTMIFIFSMNGRGFGG